MRSAQIKSIHRYSEAHLSFKHNSQCKDFKDSFCVYTTVLLIRFCFFIYIVCFVLLVPKAV